MGYTDGYNGKAITDSSSVTDSYYDGWDELKKWWFAKLLLNALTSATDSRRRAIAAPRHAAGDECQRRPTPIR